MIREFEGKTEKEAIDNAIQELGLEREEFDVESQRFIRKFTGLELRYMYLISHGLWHILAFVIAFKLHEIEST